jgi:FdhE protein
MHPAASRTHSWDERIARSRYLAGLHPVAADLLTFYAAVAEYQRSIARRVTPAREDAAALSLSASVDAACVVDLVPDALAWLERVAPPPMTSAVPLMRRLAPAEWRALVERCLAGDPAGGSPEEAVRAFVVETLIQPIAEGLAPRPAREGGDASRCPFCSRPPVAGVLRDAGQGTTRSLLCGLCLTEWRYVRIGCPACGERTFDALPVFSAEEVPTVRLEGCDTCHSYLKTIDLSKDGRAIPLVDDVATVSLDLWAREQGYRRLRENLLRI